jgi:hypothetical protein
VVERSVIDGIQSLLDARQPDSGKSSGDCLAVRFGFTNQAKLSATCQVLTAAGVPETPVHTV